MTLNLILGDKNPELINAWETEFAGLSNVTVRGGNVLLTRADALVSPANSFGFMDGGIDWSISELFEWKIQATVQAVIRKNHNGELLVGQAEIVETGFQQFPFLVCAPTMRVPQNIADTINPFLAMRAILIAIRNFNSGVGSKGKSDAPKIQSVAIPGLGTGAGRMPFERCAKQMRAAYDEVNGKNANLYRSLNDAIAFEQKLKS